MLIIFPQAIICYMTQRSLELMQSILMQIFTLVKTPAEYMNAITNRSGRMKPTPLKK